MLFVCHPKVLHNFYFYRILNEENVTMEVELTNFVTI